MTVDTTPHPGALVDIKLSQAALDGFNLHNSRLGNALNEIFHRQKESIDLLQNGGPVVAGGLLRFTASDAATVTISGQKQNASTTNNAENTASSAADAATQHLTAASVVVSDPKNYTEITQGQLNYSYTQTNQSVQLNADGGTITHYRFQEKAHDPEYPLGKTTVVDYTGNLQLNPQASNATGSGETTLNNFLHGTLNTFSLTAEKFLKSMSFSGDLDIKAYEYLAPLSEVPEFVTSASGVLDNYAANFYDGSYLKIKAPGGANVSEETSLIDLLRDPSNWSGDDSFRLDLPDRLDDTININTGAGNDKITAKGGNGELYIDTGAGDDQITLLDEQSHLSTGEGIDTLRAAFTEVYMSNYSGLENFIFTGKEAADIIGNLLDNQITGGNFNDQISGGLGNDVLQGLGGADNLFGGAGDDQLFGGAGNDVLTGGEGVDTLWGGSGNDLYLIEDVSDIVNESRSPTNAGDAGGVDTVWSYINHYSLGARIENLTLMGEAVSGQGNALANIIRGNDGDNTLSGEAGNDTLYGQQGSDRLDGGTGADSMWGGAGDDTYVIDNARDRISEAVSSTDGGDAGGNDTVESGISFTLAQGFENLVLTGKGNLNGTGNDADNRITGNEGNNVIDGKGGVDSLNGGEGSDIYLIGNSDEHRVEEFIDKGVGSGDVDEVRFAPQPVTVAAVTPVETPKLKLFEGDTGIERVVIGTGTGKLAVSSGKIAADIDASEVMNALTLVGNAGQNELTGTGFNDTLIGNGGNDVLIGGAGSDKFVFNMTPNARTDVDTIKDFTHGEDQMLFVRSKFANIGPVGDLAEGAFYSGDGVTKAHDADDRFIFDTHSGNLYFDRDGSGSGAAVLIGVLTPGSSLAATDFKIVDVI